MKPSLYKVGCVGRITQIAETGDGRYLLQLTGIVRFRIEVELPASTPYRQCRVLYAPFTDDFTARKGEDEVDRKSLLRALSDFLKANELKRDWEGIENAPNGALVNALAMMSPYGAAEKQALLEAPDLKTRAEILVAVTEIELAKKAPAATRRCNEHSRSPDGAQAQSGARRTAGLSRISCGLLQVIRCKAIRP